MTRGHRMRLIAVPMLLVPVLAACAGTEPEPKVASGGADPSASASAAPKDEAQQRREFAKCMRAAGIDVPDPNADGMIAIPAQRAGETASAGDKKMQAAMEKCRDLLPNGGEPPKLSADDIAKMRELSRCMRENGVPDFPDPDPATGALRMDEGSEGDSAAMRKASEKCQGVGPAMLPAVPGK